MSSRRAEVFLYGLFMDQGLLQSMGLSPQNSEIASVSGLALRIGQRAALVPDEKGKVYGVVVSLTLDEVERLYSDPTVQAYRPQAVLARLASGGQVAALCYNLREPPLPSERNPDYAAKLRGVAERVGLPREYVDQLK
jgi:Gamma-glutamyl cyclotransferase, AIG2-like